MFGGSFTQRVVAAEAAVLLARRKPNTSAAARRLTLNRIVTPLFGHAFRERGVACGRHRPHDARGPQTPCRAPLAPVTKSHASVASRLERGECSLFTDVASRALRLSVHPNPRLEQSACPRGSVLLSVAAVM